MKKFLKIIALTILTVLVLVIGVLGQPTFTFTGNEFTKNDYSTILADNVSGNPLVTDIALLAAHDTLSEAITRSSKPSVGGALASDSLKFWTDTGIFQGAVGGFIARNSIAQKSEVYPLLTHGVRYLDIRIAEHDGEWYGCHGLLAAPIDGFLIDTIRFLSKTDGEFVVVELRHTYFETVGYYELFEYIASVKYEGKSLLDYVRYDKNDTPLEELRYNDVVNGGSGVIFVMREGPTDMFVGYIYDDEGNVSKTIIQWGGSTIATGKDYDLDVIFRNFKGVYGEVVYDPWHNQTTDKKMLEGIRETAALLKENKETYTSVFRINQAQKTPKFELDSIPASLFGWSLLDLANRFNAKLLEQPDFKEWLSVMPVFQVDYADSMKGGFNDKVVAILNEYNRGL